MWENGHDFTVAPYGLLWLITWLRPHLLPNESTCSDRKVRAKVVVAAVAARRRSGGGVAQASLSRRRLPPAGTPPGGGAISAPHARADFAPQPPPPLLPPPRQTGTPGLAAPGPAAAFPSAAGDVPIARVTRPLWWWTPSKFSGCWRTAPT